MSDSIESLEAEIEQLEQQLHKLSSIIPTWEHEELHTVSNIVTDEYRYILGDALLATFSMHKDKLVICVHLRCHPHNSVYTWDYNVHLSYHENIQITKHKIWKIIYG